MRQYVYNKAHEMLKKAHKYEYKNILDVVEQNCRKSLSAIGWNDDGFMQYSKSRQKNIPTLQQEKKEVGTRFMGALIERSAQGPLNQHSDFKDTRQACKYCAMRKQQSLEVETNLLLQQVGQIRNQLFANLDEHAYGLDAFAGCQSCLSSKADSSSSSSSWWKPSSDLWSMWKWDLWKSSSWSEQCFFLKSQNEWLFSLAGNLISWQSIGGVNSARSAHS